MAKAPAFQMYVRDWLTATERLSLAAQGAWMRMCCNLHLARPRGTMTLPLSNWARLCGCPRQATAKKIIDELAASKVAEVEWAEAGVTIACRRMLRQEEKKAGGRERTQRFRDRGGGDANAWTAVRAQVLERDDKMCAYCGRRANTVDHVLPRIQGGGMELTNLAACCKRCNSRKSGRTVADAGMSFWKGFDQSKLRSNTKVTPPSASAVSSASATAQKPPLPPAPREGYSEGFEKWWAAYPQGQRKRGKPKCWKKWKREKLETRTEGILGCLAAAKRSRDWKRDGGQYIPGPHPWLNSAPWLTEEFAKHAADGPVPGFVPKMGSASPEDLLTRAWTYELTGAQRQEWFVQAEKEMPGQPKPLIWAKARKLWEQGRLRATGKE